MSSAVQKMTGKAKDDHWATAEWMYSDSFGYYSFVQGCSLLLSFIIVTVWYFARYWWLSNLIGICMAMAFLKII